MPLPRGDFLIVRFGLVVMFHRSFQSFHDQCTLRCRNPAVNDQATIGVVVALQFAFLVGFIGIFVVLLAFAASVEGDQSLDVVGRVPCLAIPSR